jgi:hypothetical protein
VGNKKFRPIHRLRIALPGELLMRRETPAAVHRHNLVEWSTRVLL